jgi:hypothetical protein
VRLAQAAPGNPELRESLLQMAREWMAVAMREGENATAKLAGAGGGM